MSSVEWVVSVDSEPSLDAPLDVPSLDASSMDASLDASSMDASSMDASLDASLDASSLDASSTVLITFDDVEGEQTWSGTNW